MSTGRCLRLRRDSAHYLIWSCAVYIVLGEERDNPYGFKTPRSKSKLIWILAIKSNQIGTTPIQIKSNLGIRFDLIDCLQAWTCIAAQRCLAQCIRRSEI